MNTSVKPGTGASSESQVNRPAEDAAEGELDKALEGTFPASDPPAVTPGSISSDECEDALDEALEESFPASDPPSPVQPGKN